MKTGIRIAAVCAIVSAGLAAPAVADEIGEKIANVLCSGTASSYRLSPQEEAAWNEAHSGSYSASPGVTYSFSKEAGTTSGKCTWRRSLPPATATANVTKSGSTLNRGGYAQSAPGVL